MCKLIKLLQSLLFTIVIMPVTVYAAPDIDLDQANDYMRQVRAFLDTKTNDFNSLESMLDRMEDLQDQANSCIEHTNGQLQAISDLEKDSGLSEQLSGASEDAIYIKNKKQLQAGKLSGCRLFVFKSQDLIVALKEVIHDASQNNMLTVSEPMWQLINNKQDNHIDVLDFILVAMVTISIIWCLWLLPSLKFMNKFEVRWSKQIASLYRIILAVVAIIIITLELVGYRQLAVYLSQGALLTVGLLLAFMLIVYIGNTVFVQDKMLKSIVITKKYKFIELKLLKFSLYALIGSWFFLLLLEWWGVPIALLENIKALLLSGETVYGIKIIPMRLLMAVLVFSIIQIVGKYLAVYISRQNKFEGEAETQIVISSLITYVVFSVAVVGGLFVSGFDFTSLAIVAGALSVGVGLGLQNIVSNFVSGLILLIEKPIKPGDRIMIKGIEGFVKKISVRSTRIVTLLREDVIIPNSDLIANPITNFVFHDTLSKLSCVVNVAYDSNVDLVRETLLNIALKHQDVLNDPLNHPSVVLKGFADNSLVFELMCVVSDVNKKYAIASEINIMIVKAFRENNIVMPFPQLDIHVDKDPFTS